MRISPTPCSSSAWVIQPIFPCPDRSFPAWRLGNPRNRDYLVPGDHYRPGVALSSRHLRVHEQILHLLAPACEPVAGPSCSHVQPADVTLDEPRSVLRPSLEANEHVLALRSNSVAESGGP